MNKDRKIILVVFIVIISFIGFCIFTTSTIDINKSEGFNKNTYKDSDTYMIMNRHMGYVNFNLFKDTLRHLQEKVDIAIEDDSVILKSSKIENLLGQNSYNAKEHWTEKYQNLPIRKIEGGFKAKLEEIDGVEYILIPYQVISNVIKNLPNSRIN